MFEILQLNRSKFLAGAEIIKLINQQKTQLHGQGVLISQFHPQTYLPAFSFWPLFNSKPNSTSPRLTKNFDPQNTTAVLHLTKLVNTKTTIQLENHSVIYINHQNLNTITSDRDFLQLIREYTNNFPSPEIIRSFIHLIQSLPNYRNHFLS